MMQIGSWVFIGSQNYNGCFRCVVNSEFNFSVHGLKRVQMAVGPYTQASTIRPFKGAPRWRRENSQHSALP